MTTANCPSFFISSLNKMVLLSFILILLLFLPIAEKASSPIYPSFAGSDFDYNSIIDELNIKSIASNVEAFSSLGSRVTGYPGFEKAAEMIYEKFMEYGMNVTYEYFDAAVPYDYGANITILSTGEVIKVYSLLPNLIETCAIGPQGIEGKLIYVGDGKLSNYKDKIEGNIVLMDFYSRDNWLYAAQFGAKAVVFIGDEIASGEAALKFLTNVPLDFPRLYVKYEDGIHLLQLLNSNRNLYVNVKSLMVYQRMKAKNVIGVIRGSTLSEEIVVISAYYDSTSVVPSISPGADEATGISTLLEIARYYSIHKPKRTVMFVAFSGHNEPLIAAGAREFVYKHFSEVGTKIRLLANLDLSSFADDLSIVFWSRLYEYFKPGARWDIVRTVFFGQDGVLKRLKDQVGKDYPVRNLLFNEPAELYSQVYKYRFNIDSEPFSLAGGLGFSYYTNTIRLFSGTPFDTFEKMTIQNLVPQCQFILASLLPFTHDDTVELPLLSPTPGDIKYGGFTSFYGKVKEYDYNKAWYEDVPNSIVVFNFVLRWNQPPYTFIIMTDENGTWCLHGIPHQNSWPANYQAHIISNMLAFKDDPTYGPVEYACDLGKYGIRYLASGVIADQPENYQNIVVFKCGSISVIGIVDPQKLFQITSLFFDIRFAGTDENPEFVGSMSGIYVAMLFAQPGKNVESIVKSMEVEPIGWLVNATSEHPEGFGYEVRMGKNIFVNTFDILRDLYWLDESRIRGAESSGIEATSAVKYHKEAEKHLENALEAFQRNDYEKFYFESLLAWGSERSSYVETRFLLKDVEYSMVFFFILTIPVALLIERLIGMRDSKERIVITSALAFVFVMILYIIHPAFRVAQNLYMTILGFVLFVLTAPAAILLFSGVNSSLRKIRLSLLGMHFAETSRGVMLLSAFSIGIENIKRRKFRSLLTLASIIIIIFSLIAFTNVTSITFIRPTELRGKTSYNGLFVRYSSETIAPINRHLVSFLRHLPNTVASERICIYPIGEYITIFDVNQKNSYKIRVLFGLEASEQNVSRIDSSLVSGMWFHEEISQYTCIISNEMAGSLNVSVGDMVTYSSIKLQIIGIYDSARYLTFYDLDQYIIAPLRAGSGGIPISVYPSEMMLIPHKLARNLGGQIFNVAISFRDENEIFSIAENLSRCLPNINLYSGANGIIRTYYKGSVSVISGWIFLVIPFVIASLSILNLMLGSIYERIKEIEIYSSIGLSPTSVSLMFLAESLIDALIGGFLGYVIGNVGISIIRTLKLMPAEFFPNTSSSAVVIAVALGILTTVSATLYPIYKSSKMVTPSLERKWKMPTKPAGDSWTIPLPITVNEDEADGVILYMREYFNAHTVERTGDFWIKELKYAAKKDDSKIIKTLGMITRLKPYEAGIEQGTEVSFVKDEKEIPYKTVVHITRHSGIKRNWEMANRIFIDNLRKQLLLWRSLRGAEKERYLKGSNLK